MNTKSPLIIIIIITFTLSISIFTSSISAFPNISSIPPAFLPNSTKGAWDGFNNLSGCRSGQTVAGISKLKNYFHYFGYLNSFNQTGNFTDNFDDSLESAVKNYQKNFNLNTTGTLDEETMKQILKPRCGVADIINGSSTMNSGKFTPFGKYSVAHYSFFPGAPRWRPSQRELTYAFDPRNQLSDDVKRVFTNAFARWSEWTPLTFRNISQYNAADLKIGFYSGEHGDGESFDGVLGTLAHAFAPPAGLLHMDSAETWIINDVFASGLASAMDLESVAVHEIGHLLGLGHSSVEEAVMFPTISSGVRKVELARDDVDGIQELYGTNPDSNGTTGPTFGEREMSGATRGSGSLGLVGLLLLLAVGLMF
ncbi:metalloendoproteinase 3-MMP-like [Bidens hawaiensis]|uniref:metalloendoproteinase 3-MMP-like n=1 Tax=Bidens hawaiensis TaxID=980011 RepID=UPI00404A4FC9